MYRHVTLSACSLALLAAASCARNADDSTTPGLGDGGCEETSGECAALRQRVRRLESRIRKLEDARVSPGTMPDHATADAAAGSTDATRGASAARASYQNLPMVKLTPGTGKTDSAAGHMALPRAGAVPGGAVWVAGETTFTNRGAGAEPARASEGAVPSAGQGRSPADLAADPAASPTPSWEPSASVGAGAVASPDARATKSYRLVGSRLVDLTKGNKKSERRRVRRSRHQDHVVDAYKAAMRLYRGGDHASAKEAFATLSRRYPDHAYADNALYWQGEAAYDQAQYTEALAAFTDVVERYGGGNKAADALLKIGLCYGRLGDGANARDVLTQLIAAYPRSEASRLARKRLDQLPVSGE